MTLRLGQLGLPHHGSHRPPHEIAKTAAGASPYVDVLGFAVRPSAYYTLIVPVAAIFQVILMPMAGALADHPGARELLGVFARAFATL